MLHGRQGEQAAIDRLLGNARATVGGALLVRGDPGIGKSALLDYAAERSEGMRVLRAQGVEAESTLTYATLHQLLQPVLDHIERLPEPQARALSAAVGLETGEARAPFLVSVAALTLLSEVAVREPLLCIVDDLQWADAPSANVVGYIARRLEAEPVALIMALREGEGRPAPNATMPELRLSGLDRDAAAELLEGHWSDRCPSAVRARLVRAIGGNPLALIELPGALTSSQLAGRDPLPEPLPLAGELERVFVERVRRRPMEEQSLLLLAAIEGGGRLGVIRRAAEKMLLESGLIESRGLDDFVRIDGTGVRFLHPMVRSAVVQNASELARRAAHQAVADSLEGDDGEADRRAWHLANATESPDEMVARELEHSADRAMRRSGYATAVAALHRAADLSSTDETRARRLVAAAGAAWAGGDAGPSRALLEEALQLRPSEAAVRLDLQLLLGSIELRSGVPADGLAILLPAAKEAVAFDGHRAISLLIRAREAAYRANDSTSLREIGRITASLPSCADPTDALMGRLLLASAQISDGLEAVVDAEDLARVAAFDDPELLVPAGGMVWGLGHHELGRRLRATAVTRARLLGAAGTLAWALEYVVAEEIDHGHYQSAEAHAYEGRRLALEAGRPNCACLHLASLAEIASLRGREQDTIQLADLALAEASERRLLKEAFAARHALGMLALAAGRNDEALARFEALGGAGSQASTQGMALAIIPDLVEAAARAGDPDGTRDHVAAFASWSSAVGSPELRARALRSQALLTTGEEAERCYGEALRLHHDGDRPLDRARTQLLFGEFLRRARRREQARPHLRDAHETFGNLGADVWAERARNELRATGETARKRDPSTLDLLTPRELLIAQAVGEGSTNREVAAQLFISPRTVDYHLRKVFSKLGISSRAELIRSASVASS